MEKKTAMEELIKIVEEDLKKHSKLYTVSFREGAEAVISIVRTMLPKERQQIEDSWENGYDNVLKVRRDVYTASDYFTQTYGKG